MTEEEINIAIAEACDLFKIEPLRRTTRKGKPDPNGVVLWYCEEHHGGAATYARVPNYCNDRNVMHEALSILTEKQYEEFCFRLCAGDKWKEVELNIQDVKFALKSEPREQAIVFLQTLNLWKQ